MPMREYTCAPRSRSRRAYLYVLGCVLVATVSATVPVMTDAPYGPVWFFGALFALTIALLLTVRHLVRRFVYRIVETDDGGFDFVVLEICGKRTICVCRVSTDSFRAIARQEKGRRVRVHYDWSTDLGARGYLLSMIDGECRFFDDAEEITVRFSPDSEMVAMVEHSLHRPL